MRRRDGATLKKDRLDEMYNLLTKPGALPTDVNYITAMFEFRFGLTKRKIREYLDILDQLNFIHIEGSMIVDPHSQLPEDDIEVSQEGGSR